MKEFSNSVLLPEDLPEIESETFNQLDNKYRTILFIRIFIFLLFLCAALVTFLVISEENPPFIFYIIGSSVLFIMAVYSILIIVFGFRKKGYLVREKDISYQKGLITYKLISVPFNRIQHVEVNQGVLAKIFKLSSVKIYTAGGSASDITIPGLPEETAQNLKSFLSEKISEHE